MTMWHLVPAEPRPEVEDGNSLYNGAPYALNPVALPPGHPQGTPPPEKGAAEPGDEFTEASVTAEDAINAAKLAPLGYVASPATRWAVGQFMTVSGFRFGWDGVVWVAGPISS